MTPLPEWPKSEAYVCASLVTPCHKCGREYAEALAIAAMARLRLAVDRMDHVQSALIDKDTAHRERVALYSALLDIGPLPAADAREAADEHNERKE